MTGIGYDVHHFAENRPLVLGGVTFRTPTASTATRMPTCSATPSPTRCSVRWACRTSATISRPVTRVQGHLLAEDPRKMP